jgi:hypothetical protein
MWSLWMATRWSLPNTPQCLHFLLSVISVLVSDELFWGATFEQAKNGSELVNASEATTWTDIAYLEGRCSHIREIRGLELQLQEF